MMQAHAQAKATKLWRTCSKFLGQNSEGIKACKEETM